MQKNIINSDSLSRVQNPFRIIVRQEDNIYSVPNTLDSQINGTVSGTHLKHIPTIMIIMMQL